MNPRAQYVYQWLRQNGYNHNAASGLLGNLIQESNLNTGAVGDQGSSHGIAQWRGQRYNDLLAYANATRGNPTDLNVQLGFLNHELQTKYRGVYQALQNSPSVQHATAAVVLGYEKPKGSETGIASRTDGWQNRLYQALNATGGGGGGTGQQQFAATSTPQSSGGATTPTAPQQTKVASATPAEQNAANSQSPVQMASDTTPKDYGYTADQFAFDAPDQEQAPQQDEELAKYPQLETPSIGNLGGSEQVMPSVAMQWGDPSDPAFAANAQKSKQAMGQLGEGELGNLFAQAYEDSQNIGQAGRSQEELAAMLAAKNKNGDRRGGMEGFA